ncbi:zinc-binding protein A33-like [Protopterus annectens]|uniref:zinc-binding protein A33-like n=1 Tax=Protopterus annectens TaxID=7888 RepID=UPI001CFBAFCA|nr:zinc-binding protein A33-like [Protopterus annectens]
MKLLEECQRRQEKKLSGIQNEAQILEQHITSEFSKLCQFLQDKEQQLKQQLKEEKEGILGKIEENLRKIEEMKEEVQKKIYGIQSKLEQKDSLHFLTGIKIIKKRAMEEHKFNEREGNEDDSLSLGEYKGPLQYTAWKEMLSHVNPGLSHLTLDQKKAHPHLILTDNLTSVMYGDVKLQLSDNPERYDSRLCVLGSQGFTSGRHYWEVKVWNKTDWDVGVTNDSSRKKGKVDMNPEHGYWIVVLRSGNEYRAQDLTPKDLKLTVQPRKVGVYLDYEGGQVSFYNADNMSHLYTFTDTFTETLYPFFSPCCNVGDKNKEPLKVFHMKL